MLMALKPMAHDIWVKFADAQRHLKMQLDMPRDLDKCLTGHWLADIAFKN